MPILPVPEIPQWGSGANRYRTDCGPACVAMLLSYYGKLQGRTVDDLARETALAQVDGGLLPVQLSVLGARHALPLVVHEGTTLDDIRREIDAGRPVIALVAYRYILGRLDQADRVPGKDGHFLIVLGYDDTHVVANDPDTWVDVEMYGRNDLIPVTELDRAIRGANYRSQCLFVGDVVMSQKEQALALLNQAAAIIGGLQDPEARPPAPVTKYAIVEGLNIRNGPSASTLSIGKLHLGDAVTASEVNGQWATIAAPIAGYVFNQSLSTVKPVPKL